MPLLMAAAEGMDGFCRVELNAFGPLQFMPAGALDVRLSVCPAQTGAAPSTGVAGVVFITTFTVVLAEVQPAATVYNE